MSQNTEPVSVLIVDDSRLVRHALREILGSDPRFSIVGEAENGRQAVQLAEALRPRLITMEAPHNPQRRRPLSGYLFVAVARPPAEAYFLRIISSRTWTAVQSSSLMILRSSWLKRRTSSSSHFL